MSQPTFSQYASFLPVLDTPLSKHRELLALATALAVGLAFVAPILTAVTGLPILAFAALVGAGYGTCCLLLRRLAAGTLVGLLITATFAANVPLGIVSGLRGSPGANLWLFELPLVIGLAIAAIERWDLDVTLTRTHLLFIGFVVWTFLAAVFGAGPRPVAALTYAFNFFVGLVVFAFVAAAIKRGVCDLRTIVGVLVVAVCAQAVVALAQLLHGHPFGFSRLGETGRYLPREVLVGPIQITAGFYLSGFAGATHSLIALALLGGPIALAYAILARAPRRQRAIAAVVAVGLFGFVTLSTKSSARGAALLAIIVFVAAVAALVRRRSFPQFAAVRRRLVAGVVALGVSTVVLLIPSKQSGRELNVPDTGSGIGGASSSSGAGGVGASNPSAATSDPTLLETLEGAQIPLFDLGSFGIRAQQYIAAIDAALEHPLFGLGGANFPYIAVTQYGVRPARGASGPIANAVHNAYLSVLVSTGWPGFILFCALFAAIAWACLDLIRNHTVELWVGCGVFCALAAYSAYIFWNISFISAIPTSVPFWILAGAIVGTRRGR